MKTLTKIHLLSIIITYSVVYEYKLLNLNQKEIVMSTTEVQSNELYFLSVNYGGSCPKWIRRGFLTESQIRDFISSCYLKKSNEFVNLMIFSESLLQDLIYVKNEKGEFFEVDMRSWFGDRYSSQDEYYEKIKKLVPARKVEKNDVIKK